MDNESLSWFSHTETHLSHLSALSGTAAFSLQQTVSLPLQRAGFLSRCGNMIRHFPNMLTHSQGEDDLLCIFYEERIENIEHFANADASPYSTPYFVDVNNHAKNNKAKLSIGTLC